jgi:hypothetical protein
MNTMIRLTAIVTVALFLGGISAWAQSVPSTPPAAGGTPIGASGPYTAGDVACIGSTDPSGKTVQDCSGIVVSNLKSNLNINPSNIVYSGTSNSSNDPFFLTETVSGTCSPAPCSLNRMNITATLDASAGSATGLTINMGAGTASFKGNAAGFTASFNLTSTSGNTAGQSYSAITGLDTASASDNGTGLTAITSAGQFQAFNFIATALNGATNLYQVTAGELDVNMRTGSSAYSKVGMAIVELATDAVQGAVEDTALLIANSTGAVGWKNAILFGSDHGAWPFASTAVAITCQASCGTLGSFIDMSSATISTNFLRSPGFTVTGLGAVTGLSFSPTSSTAPTNGIFLPAANTVGIESGGVQILTATNTGVFIVATGTINANDKLAWSSGAAGTVSTTFRGSSSDTAAQTAIFLGNSNSISQASIRVNGGSFSGGQGANALQISNTSTAPIVIGTGTETLKFGSSGMFTADGSTTACVGVLGPTGIHATVQKWLTINDNGGTVGYVPVC